MEKIFHTNSNQKTASMAILLSGKTDIKTITVRREKGHYIVIKGSILQEHVTTKIYTPNNGAPEYMKQKLTEATMWVVNFEMLKQPGKKDHSV